MAQIGPREAQLREQRERTLAQAEQTGRRKRPAMTSVDLPDGFRVTGSIHPLRGSSSQQQNEKAMAKSKPMPPKGGKKGKSGKGC